MVFSKFASIVHQATGVSQPQNISSKSALVRITLFSKTLKKVVGETDVAVKDDITQSWAWDYSTDFNIKPEYSDCVLKFKISLDKGDQEYTPLGSVRLPFDELLYDDVDKIRYPVMKSGKKNGEVVISFKISNSQQTIDDTGSGEDSIAPGEENNKKIGFLKGVAERVASSAIGTALATGISCVFTAAQG
ncbi:hypothetical protein L2E82_47612 [Cichorium intybus]|uniref:Uncharacterized protein n=1 Tax=Cichorium intybus TaxID=13427 RepID=A0ACB8YWH2_CICIN|nr:hypothetical protein L2E82_47612 [Cichorium intybus]